MGAPLYAVLFPKELLNYKTKICNNLFSAHYWDFNWPQHFAVILWATGTIIEIKRFSKQNVKQEMF